MVLKGFKKPLIPPCKPPCPLGLPLHLPWHFQIHHPTKVPQIHSRNLRSYETWPGHHAHHRKVQNHTVCNKFENFVITVSHRHSIFMKHSPVSHLYCHFASSLKNVSYPTSRLDFWPNSTSSKTKEWEAEFGAEQRQANGMGTPVFYPHTYTYFQTPLVTKSTPTIYMQ